MSTRERARTNARYASGVAFLAMACGGCATAGQPGGAGVAAPTATSGAVEAPRPTCRVTEPSRVVSSGAFVPAGVEARSEGSSIVARFAHRASRCLDATAYGVWAPLGLELPAACPGKAGGAVAKSDSETMVVREAREGSEAPRLKLGVVVHDVTARFLTGYRGGHGHDEIVETWFDPPIDEHGDGAARPGLVALPGDRFLLTWVDGDLEEGHAAHGQVVAGWGSSVGEELTFSPPELSVIGRPSAAIRDDGVGAVVYIASSGQGFNVMATPIECTVR
jgi:hypothetical protein